jgi:hypothetical protein
MRYHKVNQNLSIVFTFGRKRANKRPGASVHRASTGFICKAGRAAHWETRQPVLPTAQRGQARFLGAPGGEIRKERHARLKRAPPLVGWRVIETALGDPHEHRGYGRPFRIGRLGLVDIHLSASGLLLRTGETNASKSGKSQVAPCKYRAKSRAWRAVSCCCE